jgi:hypothetical protein
MVMVVVIAMVFVVPMALMHLPATLIVVVVRMAPVSACVGWALPNPWDPDIPSAASSPVAVNPDEAFSWKGRPHFIANGWRRRPDVNLDLAECRDCQSGCCEGTA